MEYLGWPDKSRKKVSLDQDREKPLVWWHQLQSNERLYNKNNSNN